MKLKSVIVRALASVPILLTLLPLMRSSRGYIRIWDFPRVQIAVTGATAILCLKRWSRGGAADRCLIFLLSACILYQSRKILPYTRVHKKQMPDANDDRIERCIRLLIANVYENNRRFDVMRQVIEEADADIVCLVEPDRDWQHAMAPLKDNYPHTQECPLKDTYGMLLYSKLPLLGAATRFLVKEGVPSMKCTVCLRSGHEVVLYCVHPRPPWIDNPSYNRDAELVLVAREMDRERKPSIVIGDLNDVAWSYTTTLFQRISHALDPRIGRGMYNSYNADYPPLRYPLDHVFATREFGLVELRRLRHAGSDHFPIFVELSFCPSATDVERLPRTDGYDKRQAQDILAEAAAHPNRV